MTASQPFPRALGRYELVHLLGQGGMGEVFLAKISGAAGFEKPCIVKTVLPALLKDRQFLDRFHHEAKVLVHLVHSSIAQVYDMGEAEGTYYMALEYVAGVDLAYLLEQVRNHSQPMPVPVALYLGQRIAEGLGYAHRKAGPDGTALGIVHRDVSPHNVMVSYEGEVKVIDFGLAKSAARSKYTLPATVMGKLGYMSPEQVRAEPLDHRSDIYSCGVVMWEMLAGRSLIPGGTIGEMMAAMSNPQVPSLHELRPEVDPALDAVVLRALAASPEQRYARTDEFARALAEQLVRSGASLGAEEVGDYVRALCPEAYANQRRLLSSISGGNSLHRTSPPEPAAPNTARFTPVPPSASPPGLEATLLRQGLSPASGTGSGSSTAVFGSGSVTPEPAPQAVAPLPAPGVLAPPPPAPVAVGVERVPPHTPEAPARNRRPVVAVLGALGLIAATAGVTSFLMRQPPPQPPPQPAPLVAGGPGPESPYGLGPPPPGMPPPPPHGEPPHGEPPPPMPQEPAQASTAPVAPVRPPREQVPHKAPEPPKPAGAKYVLAERVSPLNSPKPGTFVVPGGKRMGLAEGMVLQVVAGPVEGDKARLLGTARVVQAKALRAWVEPDANVLAAGTVQRLVVMPRSSARHEAASPIEPVAKVEPAPTPAPPPAEVPAEPRELQLRVKVVGIYPFQALEVVNTEPFSLNECSIVVGKRDLAETHIIEAGTTLKLPRDRFAQGEWRGALINSGWVFIQCAEGTKELKVTNLWRN